MFVVVGSTNPLKVSAARNTFRDFFDDVEALGLPVPSGIKPFPTSEEETIRGAKNIARAAASERPDADFHVGIEAGIVEVDGRSFVKAYAVVVRGDETGLGCSAAYEAPPDILEQIDPESNSGRLVIDYVMGRHDVLETGGVIGVLTKGRLTRDAINRDAVRCALTRFISPQYYYEGPKQA
jgi:inosine/xanthosine triphosphatase